MVKDGWSESFTYYVVDYQHDVSIVEDERQLRESMTDSINLVVYKDFVVYNDLSRLLEYKNRVWKRTVGIFVYKKNILQLRKLMYIS